jgi:hypothetical protein
VSEQSETGKKPVGTSETGKRDTLKQQHVAREQQKSVKIDDEKFIKSFFLF